MRNKTIYMDYAAATPVDHGVFSVMRKYFSREFGNPSSVHTQGVNAKLAIEDSRKKIAGVLKCQANEIVFTGGGTEGDNLAIFGTARRQDMKKHKHIIITTIEHHAVLSPCCVLENEGFEVTCVPVGKDGIVDPNEIKKALRPDTFLVSVMYANNEVGTVQPIAEIAKVIRQYRSHAGTGSREVDLSVHGEGGKFTTKSTSQLPFFHTDACQAPGALPLDVAKLGVDLMTISGAKIYGPKGVGCLYVKRGTAISPLIYGGGQEKNLRSGTENVPAIVGMARALEISESVREKESVRLAELRNYFAASVLKIIPGAEINGLFAMSSMPSKAGQAGYLGAELPNGKRGERLPNNLNIFIPGIDNEQMVIELDAIGVAVSAGSACGSAGSSPTGIGSGSHVILALGHSLERSRSSVRFSLGRSTTKKDIDFVLNSLPEIVKRIKNSSY